MEEIDISVKVNLGLIVEKDSVRVSVKNVELQPAMASLPISLGAMQEITQPKTRRETVHNIVESTARKLTVETGKREFTAAELLHRAKRDYPGLNPGTFRSHVIAAAPEHSSGIHYANRRTYFVYLGDGKYRLREKDETIDMRGKAVAEYLEKATKGEE